MKLPDFFFQIKISMHIFFEPKNIDMIILYKNYEFNLFFRYAHWQSMNKLVGMGTCDGSVAHIKFLINQET